MKFTANIAAIALACAVAAPAAAQEAPASIVSIYRAAPGHYVDLLKWIARNDEAARRAGVPGTQLYVHQNGASWDFVAISPVTTAAQDKAVDDELTKLGARTGPASGVELRTHIAEHSDTIAAGPTSAAEVLKTIGN